MSRFFVFVFLFCFSSLPLFSQGCGDPRTCDACDCSTTSCQISPTPADPSSVVNDCCPATCAGCNSGIGQFSLCDPQCFFSIDLDTGAYCFTGACNCFVVSEGGGYSWYCECTQSSIAAGAAAQQNSILVYNTIASNQQQVAATGMLGTNEGTYPDSEETYILDQKTLHTNVVQITPHWCP